MGSSYGDFVKYPRTPHLFGSRGTDDDKHLNQVESRRFNATNLLQQTRRRWIDLFADYGARVEMVYVEPPMPAVLSQNRRRDRSVPEHVISSLANKCEPPTWAETHQLVFSVF